MVVGGQKEAGGLVGTRLSSPGNSEAALTEKETNGLSA